MVVLDEMEKGDGDVLKMLLEVVEEGGVREKKGGRVKLKKRMMMMSCKVGSA